MAARQRQRRSSPACSWQPGLLLAPGLPSCSWLAFFRVVRYIQGWAGCGSLENSLPRFVLGLLLGLLVAPVGVFCWLRYGHPPVAVADPRLPFEQNIVNVPLHARIDREMPAHAAMEASPANLLLGAEVYREQCASCHGQYNHPSAFGPHMFPASPQLWAPHGHGVVGVSDDPPGETYWKVSNGIRLSGMPAYNHILNEAQMWQVSLLLANADKQLPPGVLAVLEQPLAGLAAPASGAASAGPTVIPVQPSPSN